MKHFMNLIKNKFFIVFLFLVMFFIFIFFYSSSNYDMITYDGKTYVYLDYNDDSFYYFFNSNSYYEEDIIYPVNHEKWSFAYFNGDLFVYEKDLKESKKYYLDDKNYYWTILIEENDFEKSFSITLTDDELDFLYNINEIDLNEKIPFSSIELFGTLSKTSNDEMVKAVLSLAYYDGNWYWKSEVMDDFNDDLEYVIKLPSSINNKIIDLMNE